MKANKKTLPGIAAVVVIFNVLALVLRYTSTYLIKSGIFSEISGHFTVLTETVLPLIVGAAMLAVYAVDRRFKKPMLHALVYSLFWFLPIFAEYFIMHSYAGYRILPALLLSVGWGLVMTAAMYAELTVLFFIMIFVFRFFASRKYGTGHSIDEYIFSHSAFDFHNPVTVGIFSAAAALFFYNLGIEIANTVKYLVSCAGIYTAIEILYLVFEYVYILARLLLSHYIAHSTKTIVAIRSDVE